MVEVREDGSCNVAAQNGGGREACRVRFAELGIGYGQIYEGDIEVLYMLVNRAVKRFATAPPVRDSITTMHMSKRVKVEKRTNGTIRGAYLFVNSYYFTQREAISFNRDGFIGFAGWASDNNVRPFLEAFMEWCDYMEGREDA